MKHFSIIPLRKDGFDEHFPCDNRECIFGMMNNTKKLQWISGLLYWQMYATGTRVVETIKLHHSTQDH